MSAPVYSATEIIGKSLYGRVAIPIRRQAVDNMPIVYTAAPGKLIGKVINFIAPRPGYNATLYWEFADANGVKYYTPHVEGYYDINNLQNQGAQTVQQQAEAEAQANKSTSDKIIDTVKWVAVAAVVAVVGKSLIAKSN
ncbi:MAG TPA: hypothetical protein PLO59_00110 [Bacteroidia bacterium]|nr:hypothetical protein [Bacteroidia bacterium]